MNHPKPIVYYVTAHGYGHGVRSNDVLRAAANRHPDWRWIIVTDLPEVFISNRFVGIDYELRQGSFDVGMVQKDSIRVDVSATLTRLDALHECRPELLDRERSFLKSRNAAMVVVDVPALPLQAAKDVGIPGLAVSNFTWDWIYEPFLEYDPAWSIHVEQFRADYMNADLAFRMPFSPELCFPRQETMPLVAKPGTDRRVEIAETTGADPSKKWILISFTSLDWDAESLKRIEPLKEYAFFTVMPLAWQNDLFFSIDRERIPFADVLASADAVLTKPGYGVVSECIMNRKPMIYADRSDFAEYPYLVEGIEKYLKQVHIPSEKLYAGDLEEALSAIWTAPEPSEMLEGGGGELIAERMGAFVKD